ncbi:HAD hydrolase-like protein, partial [Acinetobacter baumannii]
DSAAPILSILSRVDAAIVDLDGTMVDTMGDFNEAINRMLKELALPAVAAHHIESMVGKGSEHLLRSVLQHVLALDDKGLSAIKVDAMYPAS